MFTRQQYMNKECTHREFYAQLVTPLFPAYIGRQIGHDRLMSSTDPHLNDIPLRHWDAVAVPLGTGAKLEELGTFLTSAHCVCIAKEAARQYIEANTKHEGVEP